MAHTHCHRLWQGRGGGIDVPVLGPMLLVHAAIFLRKNAAPLKNGPPFRLLWCTLLIILLAVYATVLASSAASVRERWLQPILGFAAILYLLYFEGALNASRVRRVLDIGVVVMIVVLIVIPARVLFADALKMPQRLNLPFDVLAPQVNKSLGDVPVVITDTPLMSGDLRLNLPGESLRAAGIRGNFLAPGRGA